MFFGERIIGIYICVAWEFFVMGCLYASPTGTAVIQLKSPPAEKGEISESHQTGSIIYQGITPKGSLISETTGVVYVLKIPDAAMKGDKGLSEAATKAIQTKAIQKLRREMRLSSNAKPRLGNSSSSRPESGLYSRRSRITGRT